MALRERPISRQLEAYEDGWKTDHDEAMRCWDFEENLAVGISIFRALVQLDVNRRQRIAQGVEELSAEEDQAMLAWFQWWLRPRDQALARLRALEEKFDTLSRAAEFRHCCEEAEEIVAEWRPAAPGLAADQMQKIVAHTSEAHTPASLARILDHVSRPAEQDSVPLGFNPDDYPLS